MTNGKAIFLKLTYSYFFRVAYDSQERMINNLYGCLSRLERSTGSQENASRFRKCWFIDAKHCTYGKLKVYGNVVDSDPD